ncbi:MAG: hypothetical protein Q9202_005904 [Teloschistes flavicans]
MKSLFITLSTLLALVTASPLDTDFPKTSPLVGRQAANLSDSPQPSFSFDQLWDFHNHFLDNFIYPANIQAAKSINSTLFAENVQGRVDVTRTFEGRELNTEYLFGLFANLAAAQDGAITLLGVPLSYEVLHFAANLNVVSALTRFQFNFTALNLVIPVEISTWNTYNSKGQISQYDATFNHWQWAVDYLIQTAGKKFATNSTQATVALLTQALGKSICGTAQTYCNGTNVQYQSGDECLNFLTKQVRFGEAYELGRNTLLCRMVHQNMVPFRPQVHCPHIGKTGGGYCNDDMTYVQTVSNDYFTNAPYIPYGRHATGGAVPSSGAPITA